MLEKVNKENINNIVFHPEDDDSTVVDFNGETSTFREMLFKKKIFSQFSWMASYERFKKCCFV